MLDLLSLQPKATHECQVDDIRSVKIKFKVIMWYGGLEYLSIQFDPVSRYPLKRYHKLVFVHIKLKGTAVSLEGGNPVEPKIYEEAGPGPTTLVAGRGTAVAVCNH